MIGGGDEWGCEGVGGWCKMKCIVECREIEMESRK